jgi:hypothetical protein
LQEEKKLQIENPYPTTRKEFAYFYAPFRFPGWPCFTSAESRPANAPLRFKKANTFPSRSAALNFSESRQILAHKYHFCQGAKMFNQSFRGASSAGMVVTNTTKALEKFFINIFSLKDFLNWKNYLNN